MIASNEKNKIYKQVLRPVIFLDLFSFPATAWELWHYLDKEVSLLEIENTLSELEEQKVIKKMQGFYFLSGREDIVNIRRQRYNHSSSKLRKARVFSRLFSLFPGVIMVAAANFIGSHNWRQESDIDFFIITKENYIWRSRLFCAGVAKILFSRPTRKNKKDKICLSFYVSESALNLKTLELDGGDPYFEYWRRDLFPLYAYKGIWNKFQVANDNYKKKQVFDKKNSNENIRSKLGLFEIVAKKIQLLILPLNLSRAAIYSEGVVINDQVLKLYIKEKRRYFRQSFNKKKYEIFKTLN
ncbi:MAG TPA: hypothetical protein VFD51_00120 [Patescibacteria group bacterium]|nr:hypothetical protein [Patescibacteria group bacterium]